MTTHRSQEPTHRGAFQHPRVLVQLSPISALTDLSRKEWHEWTADESEGSGDETTGAILYKCRPREGSPSQRSGVIE